MKLPLKATCGLALCLFCLSVYETAQTQIPSHTGISKGKSAAKVKSSSAPGQNQEASIDRASIEKLVADAVEKQLKSEELKNAAEKQREDIETQRRLVTATWGLFVVGIIQFLVLITQALFMSKHAVSLERLEKAAVKNTGIADEQTRIAERQTALTEAFQQQWVRVENWKYHGIEIFDGTEHHLQISFDITNPTSLPLTIKEVVVKTGLGLHTHDALDVFLIPHESYPDDIMMILDHECVQHCRSQNGYYFCFVGSISYVDASGKTKTQKFGQTCYCRKGVASFSALHEPVYWGKEEQTESQNPK